jgi:ASPIC and UnbV/FG-GAP-like repeat
MRLRLAVGLGVAVALAAPGAGRSGEAPPAAAPAPAAAAPAAAPAPAAAAPAAAPAPAAPRIRFEEIGARAGARYVHSTRRFGDRAKADVLEMFTAGGAAVAVGDFDGDGLDDLFLTDSDAGKPNHLLHNDGDLTFTDVAPAAGVAGGNDSEAIVADALWLDYDDDGRLDLLVARFGTPLLYRNLGPDAGGVWRFAEVGAQAGLTKFGNTIAAIAFDADGDGFLDLLLGNYFPPVNLLTTTDPHVLPNNLDDATNGGGVTFWHNAPAPGGGRRFVEATREAGFAGDRGWTLDAGHADLDNDGDQDVYLAGDYGTDRLFLNGGDGTFTDVTDRAIGEDTKKGMNVDFADYDRDGWLDVYVTNITDEYMKECNMLWHNQGDGTFLDLARETGTCDTDWGWGAKFADFDNDGWEDLFAADGLRSAGPGNYIPELVEMIITPGIDFSDLRNYPDVGDRSWSGYQKKRLFHNLGDGTFREMAAEAGVANDLDGRGVGVGDFDDDGRLDFVQTNARQPSLLYHNVTTGAGHWIELRLVGTRSNRDAIGARVVVTAGGETFLREVNGGNGYASQSSTRLHFGLGGATRVDRVEIRWPGGGVEVLGGAGGAPPVPIDAISRIEEGRGVVGR